jgi:catechol 2,3-dioxygenase-like lactoylglutathione lyase family enzyme
LRNEPEDSVDSLANGDTSSEVTPTPPLAVLDCEVTGIDHIAIAVSDLPEAVRWYTSALGFKLLEKRTTRGERTGMISAVLVSGGVVVVLVQGTEPESQVSRFVDAFGAGVQHVAFRVRNLTTAVGRLRQANAAVDTPLIEDEGIRQAFLRRDPGSGVRVELIERKGGDFTDRSINKLFRAFESQDLY